MASKFQKIPEDMQPLVVPRPGARNPKMRMQRRESEETQKDERQQREEGEKRLGMDTGRKGERQEAGEGRRAGVGAGEREERGGRGKRVNGIEGAED